MGEVPEIRLSAPVRRVLSVLAGQYGSKLSVSQIARGARMSATAVRAALAVLGKGHLVQHMLLPSAGNYPPRLGYWLTGAGHDVATAAQVRE